MINVNDLKEFLVKANAPHANGTAKMQEMPDGSRTIMFADGDWSMDDNFYGGEPYGGRQVVHYKGEPAWLCVYYGEVLGAELSAHEVYGFLREALQHPPENLPVRGTENYEKGGLKYRFTSSGTLESFTGDEVILYKDKQIYSAKFIGGLVDQREKNSY